MRRGGGGGGGEEEDEEKEDDENVCSQDQYTAVLRFHIVQML